MDWSLVTSANVKKKEICLSSFVKIMWQMWRGVSGYTPPHPQVWDDMQKKNMWVLWQL